MTNSNHTTAGPPGTSAPPHTPGGRVRKRRVALRAALVGATLLTALALPPTTAGGQALACPSSVNVSARTLPTFPPPLVAGDAEFSGHGPAITVAATLKRSNTGSPGSPTVDILRVVVSMRAEETQSNWTRAEGSSTDFLLYAAPAGCRINVSLLPGAFDSNGYLARSFHPDPYSLAAGNTGINPSFVQSYRVWDDRSGSDVGVYTGVAVITRPFVVQFTN